MIHHIAASELNSTIVPLASGSTFVGNAEDVASWSEVDITIAGSPSNAPGQFYFEFSPDAVNWDVSVPFTLSGPNLVPITLRIIHEWFRVRYVNGATPQTSFRLTSVFHRTSAMRLTRFLSQSIDPNEPVELVRVAKSTLPEGAATESTLSSVVSALTGTLQVTGSVAANVTFPSQLSINNFPATQAVSGTVQVYTSGIQGVSGSVSVSSISQPVSVFNAGTVGVTGSVSVAYQANVTGSTYVTTSGSTGLLVSFGNTPPTFNSTTVTTGSLGLAVGNAASQPLFVTDATVPNQTDINYDLSDANTWYYGYAVLGSSNSAPVWTIKRVTVVAGNPTSTRWSSTGSVWDNRAALSYT